MCVRFGKFVVAFSKLSIFVAWKKMRGMLKDFQIMCCGADDDDYDDDDDDLSTHD
jgi:hypothetical protein